MKSVDLLFLVSAIAFGSAIACSDHDAPPVPATNVSSPLTPPPPLDFTPRCVDGDPTRQRYGATCLCCHSDELGVAGSIDATGPPIAHVIVTDANGDVATMAPNMFGNFFRHFAMRAPFRAVVIGNDGRQREMNAAAPSADCNACHYVDGPVPIITGP